MTLPAIYLSLTSLFNKYDALNQIIKCLKVNWNKNQDSLIVERQARDLEVRVRIPVQVQIFILKFMKL